MKNFLLKLGKYTFPIIFLAGFFAVIPVNAQVIINEIYGGGGNAGAAFRNDFVELRNIGSTAVDISGYSIQYASAAGNFGGASLVVTFPAGATIQPNGYYLIGLASGGANGTLLNTTTTTPDTTNTGINLGAGAGKLALVNVATVLPAVACPTSATIIDFVGYGTTANCYENGSSTPTATGGSPAPAPSAAASISRTSSTDTNINSADFTISNPPTPQNSSFSPTAAGTNAGGRVSEANGRGIFRALVTMTDSQGNQRVVYTNQQGYYTFENVPGGQVYVFSAFHRRYMFDQPNQVQFIGEETDGINFTGTTNGFFRNDVWNLPTKKIE